MTKKELNVILPITMQYRFPKNVIYAGKPLLETLNFIKDTKVTIEDIDLHHIYLCGYDLSFVTFRNVSLRNANLSLTNLYGTKFYKVIFTKANLSGANLTNAIILSYDIDYANLDGAVGKFLYHDRKAELVTKTFIKY